MDTLDRPVWASLSTRHSTLSVGNPLARRYAPDINAFASACDDSEPAMAALAGLVGPSEQIFVAWKTNVAAISLYKSLGFEVRAKVDVVVMERRNSSP